MKDRITITTQTIKNHNQREFGLLAPRKNHLVSQRENNAQITPETNKYPISIFYFPSERLNVASYRARAAL